MARRFEQRVTDTLRDMSANGEGILSEYDDRAILSSTDTNNIVLFTYTLKYGFTVAVYGNRRGPWWKFNNLRSLDQAVYAYRILRFMSKHDKRRLYRTEDDPGAPDAFFR